MASKPRRWHPKGEFRCWFDAGTAACWLRREPDGTVTAVVYIGYGSTALYEGIWTLRCPPGEPFLYTIYDKPHRVGWILDPDFKAWDWYRAELVDWRPVPGGPERRAPKVRKKSTCYREFGGRHDWLPRKFRI